MVLDGWLISKIRFCDIMFTAFPGMFSKKVTPKVYILKIIQKDILQRDLLEILINSIKKLIVNIKESKLYHNKIDSSYKWQIDGVEVQNWFKHFPYKLKYEDNPLASDSNYRVNIIGLKTGDLNLAQGNKEKMEIYQNMIRKQDQIKSIDCVLNINLLYQNYLFFDFIQIIFRYQYLQK